MENRKKIAAALLMVVSLAGATEAKAEDCAKNPEAPECKNAVKPETRVGIEVSALQTGAQNQSSVGAAFRLTQDKTQSPVNYERFAVSIGEAQRLRGSGLTAISDVSYQSVRPIRRSGAFGRSLGLSADFNPSNVSLTIPVGVVAAKGPVAAGVGVAARFESDEVAQIGAVGGSAIGDLSLNLKKVHVAVTGETARLAGLENLLGQRDSDKLKDDMRLSNLTGRARYDLNDRVAFNLALKYSKLQGERLAPVDGVTDISRNTTGVVFGGSIKVGRHTGSGS